MTFLCYYCINTNPTYYGLQYWYSNMAACAIATRYRYTSVMFLPRKWSCIVWLLRWWYDVTGKKWMRGQRGEKGVTVMVGIVGRAWIWERGNLKKLAENCNLKMVSKERPISGVTASIRAPNVFSPTRVSLRSLFQVFDLSYSVFPCLRLFYDTPTIQVKHSQCTTHPIYQ
jgi:hypothetical protein